MLTATAKAVLILLAAFAALVAGIVLVLITPLFLGAIKAHRAYHQRPSHTDKLRLQVEATECEAAVQFVQRLINQSCNVK